MSEEYQPKSNEPRLSKSAINCYHSCPYQYKLSYIDKLPQPFSPILVRGTQIHKIMDDLYELTTISEVVDNLLQNEVALRNRDTIKNIIFFLKNLSPDGIILRKPIMKEKKYAEPDLNISGVVDAVYLDDNGNMLLLDYKTGKGHKINDYRFELALYYILITKNTKLLPTHWGIFFLDRGELLKEKIQFKYIEDCKTKIIYTRSLINKKEFPKKSKYGCTWCVYHKKGCDGMER